MAVNLRTLAARPCGACGALVSIAEGCEHWSGNSTVRARAARVRQPMSAHRLTKMRGGQQHALLAEALLLGVARPMGRPGVSAAAKRLWDSGLLERAPEYGYGAYRITDQGRHVLDSLNQSSKN